MLHLGSTVIQLPVYHYADVNATYREIIYNACFVLVPKVTIASLTSDSIMIDPEPSPYLENVPIKAEVLSVERLQWTQPFNPNV